MQLRIYCIALLFIYPQVILADELPENLQTKNLVPWCIVDFDAKNRTPAERVMMLKELGFTRCAYDWREEHVEDFEKEILEYKKQGIEFFAFWKAHESAFALFEKHEIHPQIWKVAPSPKKGSQKQKVTAAADTLLDLAEQTKSLGCKLGLYNHGRWGGEPDNLVAVVKELHSRGFKDVGIVYNWHHGHGHIEDWEESLKKMQPYLLCLNLNGMNDAAKPKILEIGKGEHEKAMMEVVIASGYEGPIGIIDHQKDTDSEQTLRENLEGLKSISLDKVME